MPIVLIGGGSRSGKSSHALAMARATGVRLAFIATAEALDEEMSQRISTHRSERGAEFTTIEETLDLASALSRAEGFDAVIVDCLTLWVSNLMLRGDDIRGAASKALDAAARMPARVLFVTNEVGCGIVPENALARRFRDEAGWINQRFGSAADEVYWMVFGCPMRVK